MTAAGSAAPLTDSPPLWHAMTSSLGQRLKLARKLRGKTQKQVAAAVGVNQSTYSDLERGESKGSPQLLQIANYLRVNPDWLDTGRGEMDAPARAIVPAIGKYTVALAYNPDGDPDPFGELLIIKPETMALLGNPDPDKLLIHYATDASMETDIKPGQLLIISTAITAPETNKVYLLNIGGIPYLRRLVDVYGRWRLVADATPIVVTYLDELPATIIGQVIC